MKKQRARVFKRLVTLAVSIALATCLGCGPEVSQKDLGEVHFEIPQVPGAEDPYVLPQPSSESDTSNEPAGE